MSPQQQLGPYRLIECIGRGGMGEVWKARDTRLDREVAVKLSAEQFTDRFEREAKAIAALNHPNICTLFDVGPNYLVMELIDGPTLADRISEGHIPLEESLAIAKQIAEALEAAHEKNIVHRDLKPGNIKVRPDGSVKVLDFGLAKSGLSGVEVSHDSPTLAHSPTLVGVILGTAAYMAPEQARGKVVDKRADIWAFGVVFHEMVTGKRTFEGDDLTETLASVVKSDPDLTVVPPKVRRLLAKCLEKDPKKRLRDIGDAWDYLDEPTNSVTAPSQSRLSMGWWCFGAALVALAALAFLHFRETPAQANAIQFTLNPPPGNQFAAPYGGIAVSPDGRYLVFSAATGAEVPQLWLRPSGSLDANVLPGTAGGSFPFWSPDSKSLAFFAEGKLKRIDIAGGSPAVLCDSAQAFNSAPVGGTWSADSVIVFPGLDGLHRVAASGGTSSLLTKPDASRKEYVHSQPQFLPGGKSFLYFIQSSDPNVEGVYAGTLDRPQEKTLIVATAHKAIYVGGPSGGLNSKAGVLLWLRDQTLLAQNFDAGSLRLSGDPAPIAENVAASPTGGGRAAFWASDAGLLVYFKGDANVRSRMVWLGRNGNELGDAAPEDRYASMSLSPDGKRVAYSLAGTSQKHDIWIYDFGRKVSTRLTFGPNEEVPVWSPDGRFVAYDSDRSGIRQIYRKEAGGSGQEEQLTSGPDNKISLSWSRDGKYIVYEDFNPKTGADIRALPLDADSSGKRTPVGLLETSFAETYAALSPDGKWLAYDSNESGKIQVYVRAFPSGGGRWQISPGGGQTPHWRGDSKEIYYDTVSGGTTRMMAVAVRTGSSGFEADAPHELFSMSAFGGGGLITTVRPFEAAPDGQRFLVEVQKASETQRPLTAMQNWQAGLKK